MHSVFRSGFSIQISIAVFLLLNFISGSKETAQRSPNFKILNSSKLNKHSINTYKKQLQSGIQQNEPDFKSFHEFEAYMKKTFLDNNARSKII